MNLHRTLNGEVFDIDDLTGEQKAVYAAVRPSYDTNIEWTEFTNLWVAQLRETFGDKGTSVVAKEPIYKICQDLDSRLGIRQGYTREPDYRDLLADIISLHFRSRYQFCKRVGLDEGYLSSVLKKRKHLSLRKLQEVLERINYRISFVHKA